MKSIIRGLSLTPRPEVPRSPRSAFVWRKEWIHSYESPWGIFERFKAANFASNRDVLDIFGTTAAKEHPLRKASREFIWMHGFDRQKVENILGHPLHATLEDFMGKFCCPFTWGTGAQYIHSDLRLCPECIKMGFHSLFHQHRLLDTCPFHGSKLFDRCPACGLMLAYELDYSLRGAFSCKCGYTYFGATKHEYVELWSQTAHMQIQSTAIREWLTLTDEQIQRLNNIHVFPEACVQVGSSTFNRVYMLTQQLRTNFSTDGVAGQQPLAAYSSAYARSTLFRGTLNPVFPPSKRAPFGVEKNKPNYLRYEYLSLYQAFKAIARFLKKSILREHRHCIRRFVVSWPYFTEPCPYAVAYVRWREEVEGLQDPRYVENYGRWNRSGPPMTAFTHWVATSLTNGILEKSAFKNPFGRESGYAVTPELWVGITWLKSHIACQLMLNRFYDWLSFCKEDVLRAGHGYGLALEEVTYPFLVIVSYHPSEKYRFSVHCWTGEHTSLRHREESSK